MKSWAELMAVFYQRLAKWAIERSDKWRDRMPDRGEPEKKDDEPEQLSFLGEAD